MKVYCYSVAVAEQAKPSFAHPFKRFAFSVKRGNDQAFLLSEKKRFYIAKGEGLADIPASELEAIAFEKYAPLRGINLYMLVRVYSAEMNKAKNCLTVDCDLMNYHERSMMRHQTIVVPQAYRATKTIWRFLRNFDNESVDERKLQINKSKTEVFAHEEFAKLRGALITSVLMSAVCTVLGLFFMRVLWFVAVAFGVQGVLRFKRIIESQYETDKRSAYWMVANVVLLFVNTLMIALTLA